MIPSAAAAVAQRGSTHGRLRVVTSRDFVKRFRCDSRHSCRCDGNPLVIAGALITGDVDLTEADVSCDVKLSSVVFSGNVDFSHASFHKALSLKYVAFKSSASFVGLHAFRNFDIEDSDFEQQADLRDVKVDDSLSVRRTVFHCSQYSLEGGLRCPDRHDVIDGISARFDGLSTGNSLLMEGAAFYGPALFIHATVKRNVQAAGTIFMNPGSNPTNFNRMNVGSDLNLEHGFLVEGPVEFSELTIGGHFKIKDSAFNGPATFAGTKVEGELELSNDVFKSSPVFHALAYGRAHTSGSAADAAEWLGYLARSRFDADPYLRLERVYRNDGYQDLADDVYYEFKMRERETFWSPGTLFMSWSARLLTGYGRHPLRICFYIAVVLLCAGLWSWRARASMGPSKPGEKASEREKFPWFWYALDLLLPAVNLGVAEAWAPQKAVSRHRTIARLIKIAGWVLVPLGIGAIVAALHLRY